MPDALSGAEIARRARAGAAEAINAFLIDVKADAQREAPIETGRLRDSALGPDNDPASAATTDDPNGQVSFNTVYAAAQHEGEMTYLRNGQLIHWKVRNHPLGGKSHYLEDPFKARLARAEKLMAAAIKAKVEGRI